MVSNPIWEVTLQVYGPITVGRTIRLSEPKGYHLRDPFYSDIEIRRSRMGVGRSPLFLKVSAHSTTG